MCDFNNVDNKNVYVPLTVVATLLVVVALLFWIPGFNYRLVYFPAKDCYKENIVCNIDSVSELPNTLDSIIEMKCNRFSEIEMLSRLQSRGLILSPNDYASRISSYYSVLVAFLVGLFVLFSILSYFSFKNTFSAEFATEKAKLDEEKKEFQNNLEETISKKLREQLEDSKKVEKIIVEALRGEVTDDLLHCIKEGAYHPEGENIESDIKSDIKNIKDKISELYTKIADIETEVASKSNVE